MALHCTRGIIDILPVRSTLEPRNTKFFQLENAVNNFNCVNTYIPEYSIELIISMIERIRRCS
jgi:hypothetical protein